MLPNLKQQIHDHFTSLLFEKLSRLRKNENELKEMGANETKSTAGDKHETALAMLQIEQANLRKQIEDALEQQKQFEKINPKNISEKITTGSLVKTNHGYFYLSVALGKTTIHNTTVIAISPQSPLGSKLIGLSIGATIPINQFRYTILELL